MPIPHAQPARDLRSRAIEAKRHCEAKHKWSPKWCHAGGPEPFRVVQHNKIRPLHAPTSRGASRKEHVGNEKLHRKIEALRMVDPWAGESRNLGRRKHARKLYSTSPDASILVLEVSQELNEEDACFDDDVLPSTNHTLQSALDMAVERFEDKTLTQLIKEEYELLEALDEETSSTSRETSVENDDDDFELI